jgi:hypothetical protein
VNTAVARTNLSTIAGRVDYTVVIDFSPGSDCNIVDETAVFTFDSGTITSQSHHLDCPATVRPGPRIEATFTITAGTGEFAHAEGSGREVSGHGENAAIIYNGEINF